MDLDGRTVIGEVSDSDTKACYFVLKRLEAEKDQLKADALMLRVQTLRTGSPCDAETRALDIRFALHGMKFDTVHSLFWAGIRSAVVEKLTDQPSGSCDLALGADWKVGIKPSESDPFASGLLASLLTAGNPCFGVISSSQLADLLR